MYLTLIFNTFVWLQIWNLFSSKEVNPKKLNPFANLFFQNWILVVVALVIALVQYWACFAWVGVIFESATLIEEESINFTKCIGFGATVLVAAIGFKFVPERLLAKMPTLSEDKAIGEDSKLMQAYEQ